MPYGFQQILDTKPLSLKNLNDQLEMIWKKVMGGLDYRDMSTGMGEEMGKISSMSLYMEGMGGDRECNTLFNGVNNGTGCFESPDLKTLGKKVFRTDASTVYVSTVGCDANVGLTTSTAYRTLQRAIEMLPCIHGAAATINLASGTYNESLEIRGLAGNLVTINGNGATLRGSIFIEGGTDNVVINGLTISQEQWYALLAKGNGLYVYFVNGTINGNSISGGYGVVADGGAAIVLDHSALCNSAAAAVTATLCGSTHVFACTGANNGVGLNAQYGGLVTGTGTAPNATTARQETLGGKILSYGTPASSTAPPITSPPIVGTWNCIQTACAQNGMWRADTNEARQGQWPMMKKSGQGRALAVTALNTGYLFFNYADIISKLSGKTVEWAKLIIRRKKYGGNPGAVPMHLWLHNLTGTSGTPALGGDLGVLTELAWDQTATVMLPTSTGNAFKNGTAKGVALYHADSDSSYYLVLPPVTEYAAKLVIAYR